MQHPTQEEFKKVLDYLLGMGFITMGEYNRLITLGTPY